MKNILKSLVIALLISTFCCIVDIVTSVWTGVMIPALPLSGGELGGWIGFGFIQETVYPLTTLDNPTPPSTSYRFSIVVFLVAYAAVFILVVLLRRYKRPKLLYRKLQTRREKKGGISKRH